MATTIEPSTKTTPRLALGPAIAFTASVLAAPFVILIIAGLALKRPFGTASSLFPAYVAVGAVSATAWMLLARKGAENRAQKVPFTLSLVAVAIVVAVLGRYAVGSFGAFPFVCSIVAMTVCWTISISRALPDGLASKRRTLAVLAYGGLVGWACWETSFRMMWWLRPHGYHVAGTVFALGVIASAGVAAFMVKRGSTMSTALRGEPLATTVLLLLASFFTAYNNKWANSDNLLHHVGVFVEPAILVRQGYHLLWDIPAQYGMLSTLSIAAMPFKSTWYGAYILTNGFLILGAYLLYRFLMAARPGALHSVVSAVLAFAATFIVGGYFPNHEGPQPYPSTGAFRFAWCYFLALLLMYHYQRQDSRRDGLTLVLGTGIWLLAIAWSAESGVYATGTWALAYLLIAHRQSLGTSLVAKPWLATPAKRYLAWCAMPPLAMLCMVAIVHVAYTLIVGHPPDWYCYVEYAAAFKSGFGAWVLDPRGDAWVLLIPFACLGTLLVYMVRRYGLAHRAVPLLIGCCGLVWSTSSYFVGRSHPNNVSNLCPLLLLGLGACWAVLERERVNRSLRFILTNAMIPLVAMAFVFFGIVLFMQNVTERFSAPVSEAHFRRSKPDREFVELIYVAGYKAGDATCWLGTNPLPVTTTVNYGEIVESRRLLPLGPIGATAPLSSARLFLLCDRFAAEAPATGWIMIPTRDTVHPEERAAILQYLLERYDVLNSVQSTKYMIVHVHRRAASASAPAR